MNTNIISQPYSGAAEIPAIARLFALCEAHDQTGEHIQEQDLHNDYSAPEYKPQRFVRLWRDQDESIIAAADIWPPRGQPGEADIPELFVWFALHPEWRGQGIEDDILAWAHSERELLSQERGEQLILSSMATSTEQQRHDFLQQHGFKAVRTFYTMEYQIPKHLQPQHAAAPQNSGALPDGMSIKTSALTSEAYAALHNIVWVDHYAYQPLTTEQAAHERESPDYNAELDLSLHNSDDTAIGFCTCMISAEENAQLQRKIGWVHRIGVRREYRGSGLGRVLLRAGVASILAAGMDSVRLGVDTSNATGALELYTSEGFVPIYTRTRYMQV